MNKETELIEHLIKERSCENDCSNGSKIYTLGQIDIKCISKLIVKKFNISGVSQQRELLLAFFDLADELPMGLSHYDREKIVEEFLANNCG